MVFIRARGPGGPHIFPVSIIPGMSFFLFPAYYTGKEG
jgi:hypothetical protein